MTKKNTLNFIISLTSFFAFCQEKYTISGTVTDNKNKETLIGVSIYFVETKASTTTNEYGFYSMTLPEGKHTLLITNLGYQTTEQEISLTQNLKTNFSTTENYQKQNNLLG